MSVTKVLLPKLTYAQVIGLRLGFVLRRAVALGRGTFGAMFPKGPETVELKCDSTLRVNALFKISLFTGALKGKIREIKVKL